jgi:tetratricopeptide (TPR) repeat protein
VLSSEPRNPIASYYLAVALKSVGELKAARRHAKRAAQRMPQNPTFFTEMNHPPDVNALLLLGEIRYLEGGDDAEDLLREVTVKDGTLPSGHYLLAQSLLRSGRREEAQAVLDTFRRTQRAEKHVESAMDLAAIEQSEAAVRELRAGIDAYPHHPRALYLLARQHAERGESVQAAKLLRRIIDLEPRAKDVLKPLIVQLEGRS